MDNYVSVYINYIMCCLLLQVKIAEIRQNLSQIRRFSGCCLSSRLTLYLKEYIIIEVYYIKEDNESTHIKRKSK